MNFYDIAEGFERLKNKANRHSLIQIMDAEHMQIECCERVLIMNENLIRLKLAKCTVTITGLELTMKNYSREGVSVSGRLHSVDFEDMPKNERHERKEEK
ncbi:MAG: YabP/YqfC family sporulation protein [Bacteroides sp.]|nr:YabP/YqfC family sporulation protein [Eubacterium sp.]MCM1419356.1 YabP/YqfC family sporulation protein [Roseburia sp.]MCM1463194.1 YabP/YqfC family sporulation protein [Bacteroides sp.]